MKIRNAVAIALVASLVLATACNRPQKRNDWRSPSPPTPCASDADCPAGTCAIELGASQGTCAPASPARPLHAPDGGTHPDIQPSSSDIQI